MQDSGGPLGGLIVLVLIIYGIYLFLTSKKRKIKKENNLVFVQESLYFFKEHLTALEKAQKIEIAVRNYYKAFAELDALIEKFPHREDWQNLRAQSNIFAQELIKKLIATNIAKHIEKSNIVKSQASKITNLNKAQLELSEAQKTGIIDNEWIAEQQQYIENIIHGLELGKILENAQKHEFKEQYKKAISFYQDALFYLKNDNIEDSEQAELIATLESKIEGLKTD